MQALEVSKAEGRGWRMNKPYVFHQTGNYWLNR